VLLTMRVMQIKLNAWKVHGSGKGWGRDGDAPG